jgi:hypothetical protein
VPDEPRITDDRAVVDRIVDGRTALLLVGPTEAEAHLPVDALPEGTTEGTWVVLDLSVDPPRVIDVDEELTTARREELTRRMDRIRRDRTGGRFDR